MKSTATGPASAMGTNGSTPSRTTTKQRRTEPYETWRLPVLLIDSGTEGALDLFGVSGSEEFVSLSRSDCVLQAGKRGVPGYGWAAALGTGRARLNVTEDVAVDVLVERLDAGLREWKPETAAQVRECVSEVIELAGQDALDLMRPRALEQEVLDLLDEPATK